MADLNLQRVDFSSLKAIAHDGVTLQILVERDGRTANHRRHRGYCLESLPTPLQAFQGLLQLAQFTTLTLLQQSDNGLTAHTQLLDQIRMIGVNSSNVAAISYTAVAQKIATSSRAIGISNSTCCYCCHPITKLIFYFQSRFTDLV